MSGAQEAKEGGKAGMNFTPDEAATKIQALVKRFQGVSKLLNVARSIFEIGYDADTGDYFYYNKMTHDSLREPPLVLRNHP